MSIRLSKVLKEFNVSFQTVNDALTKNGFEEKSSPNEKIEEAEHELLKKLFGDDKSLRTAAAQLMQSRQKEKKPERKPAAPVEEIVTEIPEDKKPSLTIKGRIDLNAPGTEVKPEVSAAEAEAVVTAIEPLQEEAASDQSASASASAPEVGSVSEAAPAKDEKSSAQTEAPEVEVTVAEAPSESTEAAALVAGTPSAPEAAGEAVEAPETHEAAVQPQSEETAQEKQLAEQSGEANDGVFRPTNTPVLTGPKVLGTIDLSAINASTRPPKKSKAEKRKQREAGTGASVEGGGRKKRNRINTARVDVNAAANQADNNDKNRNAAARNQQGNNKRGKSKGKQASQPVVTPEMSEEDAARRVRETLARLTGRSKGAKGVQRRKDKREQVRQQFEEQQREAKAESQILKITEFVTANELATMMNVAVTEVIGKCMQLGIMVSINQRLDAETIDIVADEFGFKTEFISAEVSEAVAEVEDNEEDLTPRAPIVTVMGHVDHGKTSLLDYVRKSNVIAGEAGGITQHVGAYNVTLENGRRITFLDTPGHEAFTAMRARGAQVTDIAIIIIAADDDIMPQTKEAINHAVAAGVPIVFAINKIDKPGANPDKIKEGLAQMNYLVEEWGGKYQSQDISAKKGLGVDELLEKVLLEADMLELKANPNRRATGTVIESSLDKGRGYVATVLVSTGTLHQGDIVLAGTNYGRVKALFNERNHRINDVGPSEAATLLGFNGAPQAGDQFHVMETEQEAREIASKREQLQREQDLRTRKILTLDEMGRRIKLGSFQELNLIVKGDVDGSVEALSDSFIKLSTEQIAVNVIHKGVGQISENDVTLAAASSAAIIGFQVRPSQAARKQAERDGIDIRLYSVIYDAIDEVKQAMEGMLEPVIKEEVTATVEVRQVYRITKVGLVAGAYVVDGKVSRTDKARLIRDGIVVFTGSIMALKRFKDDVKEVTTNFECGISLQGCNDIKEGDIIETYKEIEVRQKL